MNCSCSFAVFLCLQCAGVHRGFGVHVRCVTLNPDIWYIPTTYLLCSQLREISLNGYLARRTSQADAGECNAFFYARRRTRTRLHSQIGGNAPFREFIKAYDPQTGGYKEGMNPYDTYHSWAASQYKEKVRDPHRPRTHPRN